MEELDLKNEENIKTVIAMDTFSKIKDNVNYYQDEWLTNDCIRKLFDNVNKLQKDYEKSTLSVNKFLSRNDDICLEVQNAMGKVISRLTETLATGISNLKSMNVTEKSDKNKKIKEYRDKDGNLIASDELKYDRSGQNVRGEKISLFDKDGNEKVMNVKYINGILVQKTFGNGIVIVYNEDGSIRSVENTNTGEIRKYNRDGTTTVVKEGNKDNSEMLSSEASDEKPIDVLNLDDESTSVETLTGDNENDLTARVSTKNTGLNLRVNPGTNENIITSIPKDANIEVLGKDENGWTKVRYNNQEGYVASNYITMNTQPTNSENIANQTARVITNNKGLNFRTSPNSQSSNIITSIPKDANIEVLGKDENGWTKVRYNNQEGYVASNYISINEKGE